MSFPSFIGPSSSFGLGVSFFSSGAGVLGYAGGYSVGVGAASALAGAGSGFLSHGVAGLGSSFLDSVTGVS